MNAFRGVMYAVLIDIVLTVAIYGLWRWAHA